MWPSKKIFTTLSSGGTLIVASDEERVDLDRLAELIDDEHVERVFVPPLVLSGLARRLTARPPCVSDVEVTVAGEQLEITSQIRELFTLRPRWTSR